MLNKIPSSEALLALLGEVSVPSDAILHRYKVLRIGKRCGGYRVIHSPCEELKRIQRALMRILAYEYGSHVSVHGYVKCRSAKTNAAQHIKQRFILNLDALDFFGSFHFGRIRGILKSEKYGATHEVATIIAKLTTYRGFLPQGAPTSPVLTNMICAAMDEALTCLAERFGCRYTRYSDDITISCNAPTFPAALARYRWSKRQRSITLGPALLRLFAEHGLAINPKKTRLLTPSDRQLVTGLVINDRLNVPRPYIRNLRAALANWRRHGYEAENAKFQSIYARSSLKTPDLRDALFGKIQYIGHIRGYGDGPYMSLRNQFDILDRGLAT